MIYKLWFKIIKLKEISLFIIEFNNKILKFLKKYDFKFNFKNTFLLYKSQK